MKRRIFEHELRYNIATDYVAFWGTEYKEKRTVYYNLLNNFLLSMSKGNNVFFHGFLCGDDVIASEAILEKAEPMTERSGFYLHLSAAQIDVANTEHAVETSLYFFKKEVKWPDFLASSYFSDPIEYLKKGKLCAYFETSSFCEEYRFICSKVYEKDVMQFIADMSELGCKTERAVELPSYLMESWDKKKIERKKSKGHEKGNHNILKYVLKGNYSTFWCTGVGENHAVSDLFNDFISDMSKAHKIFLYTCQFPSEESVHIVAPDLILEKAEVILEPFKRFFYLGEGKVEIRNMNHACGTILYFFEKEVKWPDFLAASFISNPNRLIRKGKLSAYLVAGNHDTEYWFACNKTYEKRVLQFIANVSELGYQTKHLTCFERRRLWRQLHFMQEN